MTPHILTPAEVEAAQQRRLPEDADERRMFDASLSLYGDSLLAIAAELSVWHSLAPRDGSYRAALAIYANEVTKSSHTIRALRQECGELADKLYLGAVGDVMDRLRALAKGE